MYLKKVNWWQSSICYQILLITLLSEKQTNCDNNNGNLPSGSWFVRYLQGFSIFAEIFQRIVFLCGSIFVRFLYEFTSATVQPALIAPSLINIGRQKSLDISIKTGLLNPIKINLSFVMFTTFENLQRIESVEEEEGKEFSPQVKVEQIWENHLQNWPKSIYRPN